MVTWDKMGGIMISCALLGNTCAMLHSNLGSNTGLCNDRNTPRGIFIISCAGSDENTISGLETAMITR